MSLWLAACFGLEARAVVIGSVLGSVCGLLLWFSRTTARIIDPFMVALNGLPKCISP